MLSTGGRTCSVAATHTEPSPTASRSAAGQRSTAIRSAARRPHHGQSLSSRTALHSHPLRSPSPTPRPVAQQPDSAPQPSAPQPVAHTTTSRSAAGQSLHQPSAPQPVAHQPDSAPQPSAPRHRPRHQPRHRPRHQPSHRPRHQPRYRPRHPTWVFHIMLTRQPRTTFRSSLRPHQPPRVSAVSSRSDIMLTLTHASTLSTNPELRRRGGVGPRVVSPPVRFPNTVGTVSCACLLTFDVTESPTHVCVHKLYLRPTSSTHKSAHNPLVPSAFRHRPYVF